ncbi:S9 family peptidase [Microbacterium sp. RU33B]|uniref:alpha/beta hydrolase family protein n=1 Tax=Microbacterium sp. RU33B TaxID=1907390 RepID=UPI0009789870|nr:hypothetical protein [Microbacterium sp. RU33B]
MPTPTPSDIRFSADDEFDWEIKRVIGLSFGGGADLGAVLAATAGVGEGDHAEWFRAWHSLAQRTADTAHLEESAGRRVSAAGGYLRASVAYDVAVQAASALENPAETSLTFREQRDAWDSFVACTPADVERVDIPCGSGSLPGWLFRVASPARRRTLVVVNGSRGSLAALWGSVGAAAHAQGYDVLLFDGPGQQSQLFERGIPCRPDWEHVLTPVFDYLAARDDVASERICVYGVGQGGYWVARALAFEHRFAAGVVDPGVVEAATRADELETVAGAIVTPLLIMSAEDEQIWPGQSDRLAAMTPGISTLFRFTAAEGASGHGQPLARALTAERMFAWLDERLSRSTARERTKSDRALWRRRRDLNPRSP